MSDHIDRTLRPLVEKLRARYPHVRVVEAKLTRWDDGFLQQIVRFRAPLGELKRCGLVTEGMLKQGNARSACGETAIGDGFHLSESFAADAREGCWDLDVCTESVPRNQELKMHEARAQLARILESCKRAPGI